MMGDTLTSDYASEVRPQQFMQAKGHGADAALLELKSCTDVRYTAWPKCQPSSSSFVTYHSVLNGHNEGKAREEFG